MLDKYFGFAKIQDEFSVMDSLLEHARIDEEEISLLSKMAKCLCCQNLEELEDHYQNIVQISTESNRIFENTVEQIIQADFDHQKQYDLLRLYQRIESISESIIGSAKNLNLLHKIDCKIPKELESSINDMLVLILKNHEEFKNSLIQYQDKKKQVIKIIHRIIELKHKIEDIKSDAIAELYKLGNTQQIPIGKFRALENIFDKLEALSNSIEEAATSLEWLLIY